MVGGEELELEAEHLPGGACGKSSIWYGIFASGAIFTPHCDQWWKYNRDSFRGWLSPSNQGEIRLLSILAWAAQPDVRIVRRKERLHLTRDGHAASEDDGCWKIIVEKLGPTPCHYQ